MASSSRQWKSREDYKKAKELDEARKAGNAQPELDEEGRAINPHVPEYMKRVPWYMDDGKPTLKHQRYDSFAENVARSQTDGLEKTYQRGTFTGPAATKFRPGACTNCGSMTHKAKECVERPRKVGAKYTGEDIRPDEAQPSALNLNFDGKHDRWNGYSAEEYARVMARYDKVEEERRRLKAEEQLKKLVANSTPGEAAPDGTAAAKDGALNKSGDGAAAEAPPAAPGVDEDADEFKDSDQNEGQFSKYDVKSRQSVRNLRIREDTAKYLRNLDPDSAFYDPKSRAMRANPTPDKEDATYKGDNWMRYTGEAKAFYDMQKFAWDAAEHGTSAAHPQASPSTAAQIFSSQTKEQKETLAQRNKELLDVYGGEEHINALPRELILAQTEQYTEYTADGRVVRKDPSLEDTIVRSRYPEDVLLLNHTAVWGSYWEAGKWGFACCRQLSKNSYCTGAGSAGGPQAAPKETTQPSGELKASGGQNRPSDQPKESGGPMRRKAGQFLSEDPY